MINNRRFRRPENKEHAAVEHLVLDLNNPYHARMCRAEYYDPILRFVNLLARRYNKRPIVLFIHGIKDATASIRVGKHIGNPDAVFALGAGYAADYRWTPPPLEEAYRYYYTESQATASRSFISQFLQRLRNRLGPGGDGCTRIRSHSSYADHIP